MSSKRRDGAGSQGSGGQTGDGVFDMLHDENRALAQYWEALRRGRPCPLRSEVDPRHIRSRLANLLILEDLGRGNIRFRLAGSALIDAFGMELRGMPLRGIVTGSERQSLVELAVETMADTCIGVVTLRREDRPEDRWELVLLPLRSDHGRIDRLLGALNPFCATARGGFDEPLSFAIAGMSLLPVGGGEPASAAAADATGPGGILRCDGPARDGHLTAIEGGLSGRPQVRRREGGAETHRPLLRVVGED